jgi:hypothetical protein
LRLIQDNGSSAGNYLLTDEESTRGNVISPGITSSRTRNPPEECFWNRNLPEEWDSGRYYQIIDWEIHPRKGILPEITSSLMLIQTGEIKNAENPLIVPKIPQNNLKPAVEIKYRYLQRKIVRP